MVWGETERCTRRSCACLPFFFYSLLIQGLRVSLFIFSLANHAAGMPTVITHPGIQSRSIVRSSAGIRDCSKISGEQDLREQVEGFKKKVTQAEEDEKWVAEEGNKAMKRGREEVLRGREYVMRESGAGGLAGRAMGSVHCMWDCRDRYGKL